MDSYLRIITALGVIANVMYYEQVNEVWEKAGTTTPESVVGFIEGVVKIFGSQ